MNIGRSANMAALILIAGLAPVASAQPAASSVNVSPFVAHTVAPKVHVLSTPAEFYAFALGNVTLIEQSDGFVLIDSGMTAGHGRTIVDYARSLSPKPIKAVAFTHWHNDHPQGVSAIRDAYPNVRIISTRGTEAGLLSSAAAFDVGYRPSSEADAAVAARVVDEKKGYEALLADPTTAEDRRGRIRKALQQFDDYVTSFRGTYIVPPTETFERKLVIADREMPVELLYLGRANTDGDLIAWLPKQKIVAAGDIVVAPYPFGFGSFPREWIETLGKIKALRFATLIPGHGEVQRDSAYIDRLITAMRDIRAQVAPLAKQGMPLEQVRAKVDFSKTAELWGSTPRDKANFQGLFADPMVGSAYKEALGQPIVQGEAPPSAPKPRFTEPAPRPSSKRHKS